MRIVEITGRAQHGATKPFICRGDDGRLYFVKGQHAGYHSMICEWVAARLAQELSLPVAPFTVVELPERLVAESFTPDAVDLGKGEAFGSQEIEFASQFQWSQMNVIDAGLRTQILVFDWWIANIDRILGEAGGNVNLLWTSAPQQVHLIDHNLAFSSEVIDGSWADFCANHVFGQCRQNQVLQEEHLSGPRGTLQVAAATSDGQRRNCENFGLRCHLTWDKIEEIWNELPEKWQESCHTLGLEEVKQTLSRASGSLW